MASDVSAYIIHIIYLFKYICILGGGVKYVFIIIPIFIWGRFPL